VRRGSNLWSRACVGGGQKLKAPFSMPSGFVRAAAVLSQQHPGGILRDLAGAVIRGCRMRRGVIVSPHTSTPVFAKLQQKAAAGTHRDSHQTSKTSSRTGDQLQQINPPTRSLQLGMHVPFLFLRAPPAVCRRQPRTTRLPSSLNVSYAYTATVN
jgi:hypothetical protein